MPAEPWSARAASALILKAQRLCVENPYRFSNRIGKESSKPLIQVLNFFWHGVCQGTGMSGHLAELGR